MTGTVSKTLSGVLACLLIASLVFPSMFASAAAAQEMTSEPTCSTEVAHDAFLDNPEAIEEFNDTGSVADVKRNTRVSIEETSSFYRVKAENPNSYCVHATVSISSDILPPTNLGTVGSNNGATSAEWRDVTDFDRQVTHTEITFIMPANSTVLFAPSKPTVLIPAWRDSQKHEAQGLVSSITSRFIDEEPLDKRTYTFSANGSPHVTVPLTNEENNDQQITEWRAVYRTSLSEPWDPVDKDTEDSVFYQTVEDGETVRFYFNNPDAEVEFVANPSMTDNARWEIRSFKRSFHDLRNLLPFSTIVPVTNGGIAW